MYDLCIKNGHIVDDVQNFEGSIIVNNGKIVALLSKDSILPETKEIYDAKGKFVFPGAVDPHVHLNDPGLTDSEDFYTGTCAAAAGGVTTVCEHPFTDPLPDNLKDYRDKQEIADKKCIVDYCLWGACSHENYEELKKMLDYGAIGFKAFLPYSAEVPAINDKRLLKHMRLLAEKDTVLAVHCENDEVIQEKKEQINPSEYGNPIKFAESRPPLAEIESVSKVMMFAQETGARVHIVHCSTPEAIDIINYYQDKSVKATAETGPQYLILDEETLKEKGVFAVCAPPLRSKESNKKMWDRILKGNIYNLGSDHAPYTAEEKMEGKDNIFNTPTGMPGIQTMVPVFFSEAVLKRNLSINNFVKLVSSNTAKLFGLYPNKGTLQIGADADLIIFDKSKKWTVKGTDSFSKIDWTPYEDVKVTGNVDATFVRGTKVYEDRKIHVGAGYGKFIRKDYKG